MTPLIDIIENISKKKIITGSIYFYNYNNSSKSYTNISISGITDASKCIVEIVNDPIDIGKNFDSSSYGHVVLFKGSAALLSNNILRVYQPTIEYEYSYSGSPDGNWKTAYIPCTLQWRIIQYY